MSSRPTERPSKLAFAMQEAAQSLARQVEGLSFKPPVDTVYNPLDYAWAPHAAYLQTHAGTTKRVLFMGMNPGPWGMAQTGVPFGEVAAVRDWMRIDSPVARPEREHSKRPIEGFRCARSEVSGRRLWGLFAERFGSPEVFFKDHFVLNYCPLAFMEASGRNRTPDALPKEESQPLLEACDAHLRRMVELLQPAWLIGVGGYAETRLKAVIDDARVSIGKILHPSPASPAANKDWAGTATRQLIELGVWS